MASTLANYQESKGNSNSLVTRSGRNLDALLISVVLVAVLFMEVVQFFVVNFSDWAKV